MSPQEYTTWRVLCAAEDITHSLRERSVVIVDSNGAATETIQLEAALAEIDKRMDALASELLAADDRVTARKTAAFG